MLRLFGSTDRGGLFETGSDAEQLPVRARSAYDGVIPSGNSVAAMDLLRLGRILDDQALREAGESLLRGFMGGVARQPAGYLHFLAAYDFLLGPEVEIVLAGGWGRDETDAPGREGAFHPEPGPEARGGRRTRHRRQGLRERSLSAAG
jgi:uncharacterized protein YyaL (SSP411 family)